jgi:hypothetical protein
MEKLKEMEARIKKLENALVFCANSFDDNVRINIAKAGLAMDKLMDDPNPFVRRAIVDNGYKLDHFIYDEDAMVRAAVATQGYGLDSLIYDKEIRVRKAAAKSEKLNRDQINLLAKDENPEIRLEIAKRGEKLALLSKDPSPMVRAEVANQGHKLNILIKDSSSIVRAAVASQGYGLKILLNDSDESVRRAAKLYAFHHEDAVGEWKIGKKFRTCSICDYQESKYEIPIKRCPNCNFIMENFRDLPCLKDPKTRKS